MRVTVLFICFLFILGWGTQAYAQEGKKFKKPLTIKAPAPAVKKDTLIIQPEPEFEEEEGPEEDFFPGSFEPRKELSIISEDTTSIDEGELSVVEISEEVRVDSVWIKIAEYYAIWDSRYVNPYKIDPTKFTDTVVINLYDESLGQQWAPPLYSSVVNSNFGMRGYRWHYGTDLDLETGDSVRAAFDGIVRIVRYDAKGWGNYVVLRHYNGLETLYGHLSRQSVEVGQLVKAGDLIGLGGSTGRSSGPHLHLEVRYQGNAIDPAVIYNFSSNALQARTFTLTPAHFAYFSDKRMAVVRQTAYHTVRRGDTLSGIARRYGVSVNYLCKLNRITTRTTLQVGRKLRLK
jgi:murein DD-endopeptidase MepM/ murein hydrolase activator NlpD